MFTNHIKMKLTLADGSIRGLLSSAWLFEKDPTNSMLSKKNQAAWPLCELQSILSSPQQIQSKIAKCNYIVTHLEKSCRHKFSPRAQEHSVRKIFLSPYPAPAGLPLVDTVPICHKCRRAYALSI